MRRSKIIKDERSVLNTDAFDKRRFQEIFELSEELQRLREVSGVPAIESLLRDLWASLYKMKPYIVKQELGETMKVNQTFMKAFMNEKQYVRFRTYTKLDDLTSAICTTILASKIDAWLAEVIAGDEHLEKQLETMQTLQNEYFIEDMEDVVGNDEAARELDQTSRELAKELEMALETNRDRFANIMSEAMDETIHVKDGLISLMGGTSTGKGDADLKRVPLREKMALADQLVSDPQMQSIAEWAGRFKQIANEKKHKEYMEAPERRGVMTGTDLERLLPAELGLYTHPVAKIEFLRKYAEGETMQYDQKKRADAGKGSILFCFDQSGSMSELDNQAKGFILALLSIAKKQSRDLTVVLFSTTIKRFTFEKGKITSVELARLAQTYLGGGTDYALALEEALHVIEEDAFSNADLIFVTDGEDDISDTFVEEFHERKKEKDFQVLTLVMGNDTEVAEKFSDRVFHVTDFDEQGSYTAFEI
ncbi:VWA domain-containing protein [Sporosarcina sp. Sa2YVA2]|uniref:VWA domain-containing protein n=1 Tax=Sporosarcina quadrami TaxID=2762234 RepID=A0ABR8UDX7_9BACL|nr:VWA domain-containing protein [Sporosarcina quadrami]MBD7986230.1 VWA domain-containing protein [Sporosarcina quadrami]